MTNVIGCIVYQHSPALVIVAALICAIGSWTTIQLFLRGEHATGLQRAGWYTLTAVSAGAAIWCTHFIAMIGFKPGVPVDLDPVLTIQSLLVAVLGSIVGFVIVGSRLFPFAAAVGGAIVGLAISAMHYTGMLAYRVEGIVSWSMPYLIASIVLSVILSAAALWFAMHRVFRTELYLSIGTFMLAIVALHFTGMAALRIEPLLIETPYSNPAAMHTLAFAVAGVAVVIVGAGFSSYYIDEIVRGESAEALSNMATGIVVVAADGAIRLFNKRVLELFNLRDDELRTGMQLSQYLRNIGSHTGWDDARTQRIIANHGIWMAQDSITRVEHHFDDGKTLSISCRPLKDGGAILAYDDVTEARESQKQIAHMAFHDSLTGLPNRAHFLDRLEREIGLAREEGSKLALITIDLDRFKEVNDLRGHSTGDELLKTIARRMSDLLRDGEFAARLGGDEFAAIHRIREQAGLVDFLARLEAALFEPVRLDGFEIASAASIGVALYPGDAPDAKTLINNADLAMYRAKADLSRAICFYEPGMDETVRARRALASELRAAIENNQLELHYQVQTCVPTGQIRGYEALLRWRHPERGFIPPAEFIPLAEENGLILRIGEWALRQACAAAASWREPYTIAVNISPVQLSHADLPRVVAEALAQSGLAPSRLELELTETAIFADKERSLHTLLAIKALGVSIALDDFGTGYSSLDTLRAFPFDKIKLDRSFMNEFESNAQAKAIVRAVLALGKSLGVSVLAEGIETTDQLSLLNSEGCDEAQGYLLGRPAPLSQIVRSGEITLVKRGRNRPGWAARRDKHLARSA